MCSFILVHRVKRKVEQYEYDEVMEPAYRKALFKAFNKTLDEGFFPVIIVDAINHKVCVSKWVFMCVCLQPSSKVCTEHTVCTWVFTVLQFALLIPSFSTLHVHAQQRVKWLFVVSAYNVPNFFWNGILKNDLPSEETFISLLLACYAWNTFNSVYVACYW